MNTPSADARGDVHDAGPGLSRRGILAGATAATLAAATGSMSRASANEIATYLPPVRSYMKTRLPNLQTRHIANRFAYGYTPDLGDEIRRSGGPLAWFELQLKPGALSDTRADTFASWFPTIGFSAKDHFERGRTDKTWRGSVQTNEARWTLLRRLHSHRQVHEVMTEFWLNHLHVFGGTDTSWLWRHDYDALIRSHALGRFDTMLKAAVVHPTMLTSLDGDVSQIERRVKPNGDIVVTDKVNENLGRELLELHTVGRTAGYDEGQVRDSSRILTGWTVDRASTWNCRYDPQRHYTGAVSVLGFSDSNSHLDGRTVLTRYLDYLAHHPATALRIARKLATRFVSDDPPDALVNKLADVFLSSGTSVKATLRALVTSQEYQQSVAKKVRTPTDDVVASFRVVGAIIKRPRSEADAAYTSYSLCRTIGAVPFGWPRPDGQPEINDAWSSAARVMGSYKVHNSVANRWWSGPGAEYPSYASWLPQPKIRFDMLVDHMCRQILGRGVTSRLLGAACLATGRKPVDVITAHHPLIKLRMGQLIGLLLDTPQHLMK